MGIDRKLIFKACHEIHTYGKRILYIHNKLITTNSLSFLHTLNAWSLPSAFQNPPIFSSFPGRRGEEFFLKIKRKPDFHFIKPSPLMADEFQFTFLFLLGALMLRSPPRKKKKEKGITKRKWPGPKKNRMTFWYGTLIRRFTDRDPPCQHYGY